MKTVQIEDLVSNTLDVFFEHLNDFGWQSCKKNGCIRKWYTNLTPDEKFKLASKLLDTKPEE